MPLRKPPARSHRHVQMGLPSPESFTVMGCRCPAVPCSKAALSAPAPAALGVSQGCTGTPALGCFPHCCKCFCCFYTAFQADSFFSKVSLNCLITVWSIWEWSSSLASSLLDKCPETFLGVPFTFTVTLLCPYLIHSCYLAVWTRRGASQALQQSLSYSSYQKSEQGINHRRMFLWLKGKDEELEEPYSVLSACIFVTCHTFKCKCTRHFKSKNQSMEP